MSTVTTIELDQKLLDTLKQVHNRGAELYNAGDHAGAFRLYHGGLLVAKPFIEHRKKLLDIIDEGLKQVEKSTYDAKVKAFRLHEVIDKVRSELKNELRDEQKAPAAAAPPVKPTAAAPQEATVSGTLKVFDKPGAKLTIELVPHGTSQMLGTATTDDAGAYRIGTALVVGKYHVVVKGGNVPPAYSKPATTTLTVELTKGVNTVPLEIK